ncbi:GNVR domain-containing protein [Desulfonema magnum]|uniref:Polysaccharide chain length determinant protein domain-containing protein n=1 Tax=Desulfonema magnum TaxID=45655 RepID=A0A975GL91_9BACT|nr:GNVR domain-containing protein [Desulfonema magnum]QTA85527.1 Polysaccharide chain length determinant protein domain-containing protein [Desulfonema magnum]
MSDEEAPKTIKIDYYLDLVVRRRWLIIIPFCLAMIGGMFVSVTTPRIYEANTLILVEPKSIPDKYVEPLTEVTVKERVSTITQQMKSRTYIERVINEAELFAGPEYKNMLSEEKVSAVRGNMKVKVTRGRRGADSFTISFRGKDPEKITRAVNILAGYFIDESIKLMTEEVFAASDFLQEELKDKATNLIAVEDNLKIYRTKYMGGLPEQLVSNLGMLSGLREQLNDKQESLRDEKVRLIQLEGQMSEARRELESYVPGTMPEKIEIKEPENVIRLRTLKQEYSSLIARYTKQHPDVIKVKKMVADLENEVAKEAEEAEEAKKSSDEPQPQKPKTETELLAARYKAMKQSQLNEIKYQYEDSLRTIKIHETDIIKILEEIRKYEKRVEDTPKREQELLSLTRDYENIQKSYNSLLTRKLDADIAVSMERKSKGQRFRILDSAKVPKKPVSPNIKTLLIMSLAAGLGLGGGLVFLLDFLDTSLRRPEDIETLMRIPVLATVPNVYHRPSDKIKQKIDQGMSVLFIMIGLMLLGIFGILAIKGVEYVTAIMEKVISKIL